MQVCEDSNGVPLVHLLTTLVELGMPVMASIDKDTASCFRLNVVTATLETIVVILSISMEDQSLSLIHISEPTRPY